MSVYYKYRKGEIKVSEMSDIQFELFMNDFYKHYVIRGGKKSYQEFLDNVESIIDKL